MVTKNTLTALSQVTAERASELLGQTQGARVLTGAGCESICRLRYLCSDNAAEFSIGNVVVNAGTVSAPAIEIRIAPSCTI